MNRPKLNKVPFKPPTLDEVREICETSGFPFELAVAKTLKSLGFITEHSMRWSDPNTQRSREVDISSLLSTYNEDRTVFCMLRMLVESKTEKCGTVVFGAHDDSHLGDVLSSGTHQWLIRSPKQEQKKAERKLRAYLVNDLLRSKHVGSLYRTVSVKEHTEQTLNFKLDGDDIHTSVDGLLGALYHVRNHPLPVGKQVLFFANVAVLVCVVRGPLYYYAVEPTAELTEIGFASVYTGGRSTDGFQNYRVDFVREDYFLQYTEGLVQTFVTFAKETFKTSPRTSRTDA